MSIATVGEDLLGGLIADGTVSRPSPSAPETLWTQRFAQRTQRITASMIRELLKLTERPEIISFAGGLPASDLLPLEEVAGKRRTVPPDHSWVQAARHVGVCLGDE